VYIFLAPGDVPLGSQTGNQVNVPELWRQQHQTITGFRAKDWLAAIENRYKMRKGVE
jgi:hypothetical protein